MSVDDELDRLKKRIPGNISTRDSNGTTTLMACRIMKITDREVVVQLSDKPYYIPRDSISKIDVIDNDLETERESGVDAVLTIKSEFTKIGIPIRNIEPKPSYPFALLSYAKRNASSSRDENIRNEVDKLIRQEIRWAKLNNLLDLKMGKNVPSIQGSVDERILIPSPTADTVQLEAIQPWLGEVQAAPIPSPDGGVDGGGGGGVCTTKTVCTMRTTTPFNPVPVSDRDEGRSCKNY
jgi:hypothetical protein